MSAQRVGRKIDTILGSVQPVLLSWGWYIPNVGSPLSVG